MRVIKTLLPEEYEFNKKNPLLASYTGGENYPDFTKRVIGAIDKIASENSGKTIVLISSLALSFSSNFFCSSYALKSISAFVFDLVNFSASLSYCCNQCTS